MIHKIKEGEFVISSYQVWRPGCYDKRATANYAFQFGDDQLDRLREMANQRNQPLGGVITLEDLRKERRTKS